MIHRFRSEIDVDILPPLFFLLIRFFLSLFSTRGKKQTGIYVDFRVGRNNAKQEISSYSKQRPNFSIVLNPLEENIGANRCNYFWFGSVMIVGRKYCFNIGGILVCNTKQRPLVEKIIMRLIILRFSEGTSACF